MSRRRRDRVVRSVPGAMEFDIANGTLPRYADRDFQVHSGYAPDDAVYLERVQRGTGWRHGYRRPTVLHPVPLAKRAAVPRGVRMPSVGSWRFVLPSTRRVLFCVRRKQRKEVMFAKGLAGRSGIGRGKRWFRNRNSSYGC